MVQVGQFYYFIVCMENRQTLIRGLPWSPVPISSYSYCRVNGSSAQFSGMPYALSKVKTKNYDEIPATIAVNVGENVKIPCLMEHRLTSFAWKLCQFNCQSPEAKWKTVIETDNGSTTLSKPEKYGLDSNGSLVVKNIQLWDNVNWFRCFYKERFVGMYHRTSIILIKQGTETEPG